MRADEPDHMPEMPEVRASHLVAYFLDVGPVMAGGMGPIAITQQEIAAWQFNNGVRLRQWESQTLRHMSLDYIAELHAAEKQNRPSPWSVIRASATARSTKDYLRGLANL